MSEIKVLIVEDEAIIAEDLADILSSNAYKVCGIARTYPKAIELLDSEQPDIILLDIQLKGERDGVDLARTIRESYHMPFIFVSSHSDSATVKRASEMNPYGYLVKPFDDDDVLVALEIGLTNFAKEHAISEDNFVLNNCLFIKQKNLSVKVPMDDILYIQADGNYLLIFTSEKSYTLRNTLKDIAPRLPNSTFFRSHKSYIVNLNNLSAVDSESIYIEDKKLPIGRNQSQELTDKLNKL